MEPNTPTAPPQSSEPTEEHDELHNARDEDSNVPMQAAQALLSHSQNGLDTAMNIDNSMASFSMDFLKIYFAIQNTGSMHVVLATALNQLASYYDMNQNTMSESEIRTTILDVLSGYIAIAHECGKIVDDYAELEQKFENIKHDIEKFMAGRNEKMEAAKLKHELLNHRLLLVCEKEKTMMLLGVCCGLVCGCAFEYFRIRYL